MDIFTRWVSLWERRRWKEDEKAEMAVTRQSPNELGQNMGYTLEIKYLVPNPRVILVQFVEFPMEP